MIHFFPTVKRSLYYAIVLLHVGHLARHSCANNEVARVI